MTDPVFNKPIPQGIESTVGYYIVSNAFTGGALNDILEKKIAIDVSTSSQSQSKATLLGVYYVNLTQGTLLQDSEVLAANITYIGTTTGGGGVASHVIVDSSALPTGAATSANQTTANTSLSTIATNTGAALGGVSPASAPTSASVIAGQYNTNLPTFTNGQTGALQNDSNGRLFVNPVFGTSLPTTYRNTALSNTAQNIKGTSGRLYGWNFINTAATAAYIKFFNVASATTGTSTVVKTIMVPATSPIFVPNELMIQHNFTTAISIAATLNIADADNTAPTSAIYTEVYYV